MKNKYLWDINNWDYFKDYDIGYKIFGKIPHLVLNVKDEIFENKYKNLELPLNLDFKENLQIFGPKSIIIIYKKRIYWVENQEFIYLFGNKEYRLKNILIDYKYKGKFYTYFLIKWLKYNIKFKIKNKK